MAFWKDTANIMEMNHWNVKHEKTERMPKGKVHNNLLGAGHYSIVIGMLTA